MSRRMKRFKRGVAALMTCTVLQLQGTCLPENYWALTARAASVTLVDTLVELALARSAAALGLPIGDDDDNGDADTGT